MERKYAKAYTEVLEILKHIPEEEYERIPKNEIQFYENNCDKNYKFIYDESLNVKDQTISREANAVIVSIYMNYFANEKQKSIINEILKQNSIEAEKEKQQKYDVNNIFKTKLETNQSENNSSENLPIEINNKKDNFIKKIINKIKSIINFKSK
ncbi:MAG: hypothetical protein J6K42_01775 [Clostridia bacterium]|nr:hypothetical protein [Clostridia bacterium]